MVNYLARISSQDGRRGEPMQRMGIKSYHPDVMPSMNRAGPTSLAVSVPCFVDCHLAHLQSSGTQPHHLVPARWLSLAGHALPSWVPAVINTTVDRPAQGDSVTGLCGEGSMPAFKLCGSAPCFSNRRFDNEGSSTLSFPLFDAYST